MWFPREGRRQSAEPLDGPGGGICSLEAEGEQHVARPADEAAVARVDVEHAADDHRAWTVDRTAPRLDAVDRLKLAVRVELPQNRAVLGRVGAHAAVVRGREDGTGDDRHGCALRRAALAIGSAELRRRGREPRAGARREIDRVDAARRVSPEVADADVGEPAVGRSSPLAAEAAPLAEAVLPHDGALAI